MAIQQVSVAAATAIAEYDLMRDTVFREANNNRRIVAAGLAGSAAALDTLIRLMAGTRQIAVMYNTATGAPQTDRDMQRLGEIIPGGTPIHAFVVDAPATNPINLSLDIVDVA